MDRTPAAMDLNLSLGNGKVNLDCNALWKICTNVSE